MKVNHIYITKKNLDLPNENFLIKEGTAIEVTDIFNKTDNSVPTKVEFKIDRINGNYTLDENEFQKYVDNSSLLRAASSKFDIGDTVTHATYGQGTVITKQYYNSLDSWLYGVDFNGNRVGVMESELS